MVIATVTGGVFMVLVQAMAAKMGKEYGVFNALLRFMILLSVPAAALQSIFAQQAAAAVDDEKHKSLVATTRAVLLATFVFWLGCSVVVVACTNTISHALDVANPIALWLTALVVLPTLTVPVFKGLLQGLHHFGGFGALQIIDGVGRFGTLLIILLLLQLTACGGLVAVCVGQFTTLAIGAWLTRQVWREKSAVKVEWKKWLALAIPLTLGMGTVVAMTTIDSLFVQKTFGQEGQTPLYMAAMFTGYAITMFIAPVALVMFPRLVRSAALSQKSNALLQTVVATASFGCVAALACSLLPKLVLRCMFFTKPAMVEAWPLVPWFTWGCLPMTLANVLVQNLLAHKKFKATPLIAAVPIAYALTLHWMLPGWKTLPEMQAFTHVAQSFGAFNLLLFVICAVFTWGPGANRASDRGSAAER